MAREAIFPRGFHRNGGWRLRMRDGGAGYLLVIDDDRDICALIADALDAAGLEVRSARTAAAGLQALERAPPSGVIVDLDLPDRSPTGAELAQRFTVAGVPVLMMSGTIDARERLARLPHRFLLKPFRIVELRSLVSRLLPAPPRGAAWRPSFW